MFQSKPAKELVCKPNRKAANTKRANCCETAPNLQIRALIKLLNGDYNDIFKNYYHRDLLKKVSNKKLIKRCEVDKKIQVLFQNIRYQTKQIINKRHYFIYKGFKFYLPE